VSFSDWIATQVRFRRFARGGQNMARRYVQLEPYWKPHFEASRAAQRNWDVSGRRLLVLGAGRLLDFDESLAERFEEIFFVDADPASVGRWREFQKRWKGRVGIDWDLRELTAKYDPWQMFLAAEFTRLPRADRWPAALQVFERMIETPLPKMPPADAILSLNTLSQLPIGWREIARGVLEEAFGKAAIGEREAEWTAALEASSRRIVEDHFAVIARSRATHALVSTDIEFHDYSEVAAYPRAAFHQPPEGGRVVVTDALHGVNPLQVPGITGSKTSEWLWHISPLGLENPKSGSFNRVGAFTYTRQ